MISIDHFLRSDIVRNSIFYSDGDKPVYARLPDGTLHQIDAVSDGQIMTGQGAHDVIILAVSEQTGTEA